MSAEKAAEPQDKNVYQYLLRSLRESAMASLGCNVRNPENTTPEKVMFVAISGASLELGVVVELLEQHDDLLGLTALVAGIKDRLDLAAVLGEGLYDPDNPYSTATPFCFDHQREATP